LYTCFQPHIFTVPTANNPASTDTGFVTRKQREYYYYYYYYHTHSTSVKKNPFFILYEFIFSRRRTNPLKRYRNEHLTITLPEGLTLHDIKWFYVWCEDFSVSAYYRRNNEFGRHVCRLPSLAYTQLTGRALFMHIYTN